MLFIIWWPIAALLVSTIFIFTLASECNRLKVQIEELKLMQETKDNTLLKIQDQIKHLFQVIFCRIILFA